MLEDPGNGVQCVQSEATLHFPLFVTALDQHLHGGALQRQAAYHDTHAQPFKNKCKPDNSHVGRDDCLCICMVRFIGELKKRRAHGEFTAEEKEHIVGFAVQWLEELAMRPFIIVYLTDLKYIQFFRVTRAQSSGEDQAIVESAVHVLAGAGQHILAGLFCATDEDCGFPSQVRLANFGGVTAQYDSFLGQGGSAIVFADEKQRIAIKIFRTDSEAAQEVHNYHRVRRAVIALADIDRASAAAVRLVPEERLVEVSDDLYSLKVPLGFKDVIYSSASFVTLVSYLQLLHRAGYVHRDIRPSNLVADALVPPDNGGGELLLRPIDYGTIVLKDVLEEYAGAGHHCSDAVLDALKAGMRVKFRPADDLHSLLRTARELTACNRSSFRVQLDSLDYNDFEGIQRFWQVKLRGVWMEAVAAAEACDYQAMKAFFDNMNLD